MPMNNFRKAFPDFPPETMPQLNPRWIDTSWHNDMCPSFEWTLAPDKIIRLFIDYEDIKLREFEEGQRFNVWISLPNGDCPDNFESDDIAEIEAWASEAATRF